MIAEMCFLVVWTTFETYFGEVVGYFLIARLATVRMMFDASKIFVFYTMYAFFECWVFYDLRFPAIMHMIETLSDGN